MNLSVLNVIIASIISGVIIFSTRAFPFVLFSKREPPAFIRFIEKYIPPMVMAILLVYCFKDIRFSACPYGLPYFIALAATVVLHLWKNNSMVSIFGGTILFMILHKIL